MEDEKNLTQLAVGYALQCNWKEAIKINLLILVNEPEDLDALNRLSRAYFESGNTKKAISVSKKVLKIDTDNSIAKRALVRFKQADPTHSQTGTNKISFIEEAGKTRITSLINLGQEKTYSGLNSGDELLLATHAHKVSVVTQNGKYIGKLADDISAKIRISLKEKNDFKVYTKSVDKNCVKIFIKSSAAIFPREALEPVSEFSS